MSRLNIETMTTAEYKKTGHLISIDYGFHQTKFGNCLLGMTDNKICYLAFPNNKFFALQEMQDEWSKSKLIEKPVETAKVVKELFNKDSSRKISLLLKGTPFQISVWQILAQVPYGDKISYEAVAQKTGNIKAVRAVSNAIASNEISYLIPCHRIIKKSGEFHKYRWGADLKRQLLEWESLKV